MNDNLMELNEFQREIELLSEQLNSYLHHQEAIIYMMNNLKGASQTYNSIDQEATRLFEHIGYSRINMQTKKSILMLVKDVVENENTDESLNPPGLHELFEEFEEAGIHPYSAIQSYEFIRKSDIATRRGIYDILLNSLFIACVSHFEHYYRNILITLYFKNNKVLDELGKSYTIKDVRRHDSIEHLMETVVHEQVEGVMRGDVYEWEKNFRRVAEARLDWVDDAVVEVFKRRNAHVHTEGYANKDYLEFILKSKTKFRNIDKAEVEDNQEDYYLEVSESYILSVLDIMASKSIEIAFHTRKYLFNKSFDTEGDSAKFDYFDLEIDDISHSLLRQGRYEAVIGMQKKLEPLLFRSSTREALRVNHFCAIKATTSSKDIEKFYKEVESWDVTALSDIFKLVKLSLLDRMEEAAKLFWDLVNRKSILGIELMTFEALKNLKEFMQTEA